MCVFVCEICVSAFVCSAVAVIYEVSFQAVWVILATPPRA